ncbi:unnamed protein product [Chilo suppressalis]|uniref:Uncharacterized protein n=1 Tax=Chilo suppressalis TaxID=168631 RepID=A0ABN8B3Z3_CHISP|nr:unnamed protein product [Chilo suppressalis]
MAMIQIKYLLARNCFRRISVEDSATSSPAAAPAVPMPPSPTHQQVVQLQLQLYQCSVSYSPASSPAAAPAVPMPSSPTHQPVVQQQLQLYRCPHLLLTSQYSSCSSSCTNGPVSHSLVSSAAAAPAVPMPASPAHQPVVQLQLPRLQLYQCPRLPLTNRQSRCSSHGSSCTDAPVSHSLATSSPAAAPAVPMPPSPTHQQVVQLQLQLYQCSVFYSPASSPAAAPAVPMPSSPTHQPVVQQQLQLYRCPHLLLTSQYSSCSSSCTYGPVSHSPASSPAAAPAVPMPPSPTHQPIVQLQLQLYRCPRLVSHSPASSPAAALAVPTPASPTHQPVVHLQLPRLQLYRRPRLPLISQ